MAARRRRAAKDDPVPKVNLRTRCTVELTKRFCRLIKKGLPADAACDYLSINGGNFWDWMRKGEAYIEGGGHPADHAAFGHFYQQFRKAWAVYRLGRLERLHDDTNTAWFKDLSILERRDRKTFGRNDPLGGMPEDFDPDERFI